MSFILNICPLCGEPNEENGKCKNNHSFKSMCINCKHSCVNKNNEPICGNEANMEKKRKAIMEAINNASSGYAVSDLDFKLEPIPLKKVNAKCSEWVLSDDVLDSLKASFT